MLFLYDDIFIIQKQSADSIKVFANINYIKENIRKTFWGLWASLCMSFADKSYLKVNFQGSLYQQNPHSSEWKSSKEKTIENSSAISHQICFPRFSWSGARLTDGGWYGSAGQKEKACMAAGETRSPANLHDYSFRPSANPPRFPFSSSTKHPHSQ